MDEMLSNAKKLLMRIVVIREITNYEWRITDEKGEKAWKLDETVCKRVIIDENGEVKEY